MMMYGHSHMLHYNYKYRHLFSQFLRDYFNNEMFINMCSF